MERLHDMLIKYIANARNMDTKQAVKILDDCIENTAKTLELPYRQVYSVVNNYETMSRMLKATCSNDLKKCREQCQCVVFKNKCHPRYFIDAMLINQDPENYIKDMSRTQLEELVELASYLYYNYDGGGLSDNSFDALEYNLRKRFAGIGKKYEKIGAEPIEKLRTKLPYPMMSLDKLRPDNPSLISFLTRSNKHGMVCSDKLDGVSCMVVFQKSGIKMYTRGDGTVGGDVSYLQKYINLPKINEYMVVRGELVLPKKVWQEKYHGTYANARAFVSAKVNQGYIDTSLKDIHFVAYQIVDTGGRYTPKPSDAMNYLEKLGFQVVWHSNMLPNKHVLVSDMAFLFQRRKNESPYMVDGIVMAIDLQEDVTNTNPDNTKAFKMLLEAQIRDTQIVDVQWNITRHGKLFPVAVFKPVFVDGVRITRATAHSARKVVDWHLGPGSRIKIARSGDVIPQIKDVMVDPKITPALPVDFPYKWHWDDHHQNLWLVDIDNNPEVIIKRLMYFVEIMGGKQLGPTRLEKLVKHETRPVKTIKQLTNLTKAGMDSLKIPRFTGKTTQTVYDTLHEGMRNANMVRYAMAVTTFGGGIGETVIRNLLRYYPDIFKHDSKTIAKNLERITIPQVGPTRKPILVQRIPEFVNELYSLNKEDIQYAIENYRTRVEALKKKGYNPKIKDRNFVFTGFMSNPPRDLVDYIWDNMGNVLGTLPSKQKECPDGFVRNSAGRCIKIGGAAHKKMLKDGITEGTDKNKVDAVISYQINNITSKMMQAHSAGISVYSLAEFAYIYNIPSSVVNIDENQFNIDNVE